MFRALRTTFASAILSFTACTSWGKFWQVSQLASSPPTPKRVLTPFVGGVVSGTVATEFKGVAVKFEANSAANSNEGIYAVGMTFGTGPTINVTGLGTGDNANLIKFNTSGHGLQGVTANPGAVVNNIWGLTTDTSDNVYIAGSQTGMTTVTWDNAQSFTGPAAGKNAMLMRFAK